MSELLSTGSILARLDALEGANQRLAARCERWRRTGIGGMVCVVLVVLGGATAQSLATFDGGAFVLRDQANRMRAALAIRPDGTPGLGFFDKEGKIRLSLELNPQGAPGINLLDPSGILNAAVAIRPDGTPGVGLFDGRGHVRTSLDVGVDGTSGVNVFDSAGTLRAAMAIRPDGTPGVGIFDPHGEVLEEELNEPGADVGAGPEIH
jgi:hypothetical protein